METAATSPVTIAAAALAAFVLIGGVGWVIRRFWRSAAGAALIPAGLHTMVQVKAAASDPRYMTYALISVFMGVVWWGLFGRADARRDARLRREAEEERLRARDPRHG